MRGDLTGDGRVNQHDVQMLQRWLTEGSGMMLPGEAATAADTDGDGAVTLLDLAAIMRIAEP